MEHFNNLYNKLFLRGNDAKYPEMICSSIAAGTLALYNWATNKPVVARLPVVALVGVAGYAAGYQIHLWHYKTVLFKDQALWDYVNSHPEQFPELKPKKYKDILDVWHPIR